MHFTITGMKKSVRYSVSMRASLYRGSVISRFHCKNAVNLWRIGTDCILCHSPDEKSLTVNSETVLCNISSMRRSVTSPDEILRRELKIRRAAEYFKCNLRFTFSVSYTTLFTELIYPQKRHFFPQNPPDLFKLCLPQFTLYLMKYFSHLSHFNTNQVHFVTAELPQFILALITF